MQTRQPIVTVLGHVDHGKTTLLDTIRKTDVAIHEAGGITQGIGASVVETKDKKKITFIDTPGHAAFSKMRSRGAAVCDIVVLVVDASDGVKPQTKEALNLIKEIKIPFIVAITKIDLPAANPDGVLQELEKEGILFEGRGGSTPYLKISAKENKGISDLLETINLLAEVSEIKGDLSAPLEAVVIETAKTKSGSLVSLIVRNGTLRIGETVYSDKLEGKIKAIFNFLGKPQAEIHPGEPGQVLGFSALPMVGSLVSASQEQKQPEHSALKTKDIYKKIKSDELAVVLKAKNTGGLEALEMFLPPKVVMVSASVGDLIESDILMAKAAGARIFVFESTAPGSVLKLAEMEGVKVEKFQIIYELIDRLNEILKGGQEEILGKAEIIAVFPFDRKKIAGCKVLQGKITKSDKLSLMTGDKKLGEVKAVSLKKAKQEINEAKPGEEFGVLFEPQLDFQIGDVLVSLAHGK